MWITNESLHNNPGSNLHQTAATTGQIKALLQPQYYNSTVVNKNKKEAETGKKLEKVQNGRYAKNHQMKVFLDSFER